MRELVLLCVKVCAAAALLAACSSAPAGVSTMSPGAPATALSSAGPVLVQTGTPPPATPGRASESLPRLQELAVENAAQVRLLRTLRLPGFGAGRISQCSLAFSPDGTKIAGVCYRSTAPVWDVDSGEALFALRESPVHDVAIAFSPDGEWLALGGMDKEIRLFAAGTGEAVGSPITLPALLWDLDFSPDGSRLASASFDLPGSTAFTRAAGLNLWEVPGGAPLWDPAVDKPGARFLSLAFHPGGKTIACGMFSKGVRVVDSETGELVTELPVSAPVGDVAFSPDGQLLAAGSDDHKIRLWGPGDYQDAVVLKGHAGYVNGVAFSPDGRLLASGSHDTRVGLWDVAGGELLKLLEGHGDAVLRVAFDPSGRLLASISWDGTLRLWGAVAGE